MLVSGCTTSANVTNKADTTQAPAMVWQNTYGGPGRDIGSTAIRTNDGGYAITGSMTASKAILYDNKTILNNVSNIFLVKTDASGKELWDKAYGAGYGYSVIQTSDGGYMIAGELNADTNKIYLVKADANGNELWNMSYGGDKYYTAKSLAQTGDGGYVLAGSTNSYGKGDMDVYLVKVA